MSYTPIQLKNLSGRDFTNEVKARLRDDSAWVVLLDPIVIQRTAWALGRMIDSLNEQLARGRAARFPDEAWILAMETLRRLAVRRQEGLETAGRPPVADSRQARAWRGFAARLAAILEEQSPDLIEGMVIPFDNLPVSDWLEARRAEEKTR